MSTPLRPATDGYEPPTVGDWHSGIACPDCQREMPFCWFNAIPGYPGGINAFCFEDGHPMVQVTPDGTIHRARTEAET